ncbi:helix-turn-helix domain-containing protein [Gymnodinialimonas sp.]
MSSNFGRKIKELRLSRGVTLDDLASRVGSTKAYVWQLENKTPARPSGKLLLDLANALCVAPDFLIDDEQAEPTVDQITDGFLRSIRDKQLTKQELEQLLSIADTLAKK